MIPVCIATAYNRMDLLERMLASIDEPIGRGLVIDNARTGYEGPSFLGPEWHVFSPPFLSLGYPGSINFGISQTPDAPWWFWVSNDVVFGEGDLAQIAGIMEDAGRGPRIVTHDYAWGAINRAAIDRVGLFDEWSFWPIYFDDNDMAMRCLLGEVEWVHYQGTISQGADGFETSLTINSDEGLKVANARSWALNEAAYVDKWGGLPGHEWHQTPWNRDLPLWATKPDLRGRVSRSWP